MRPYFRAGLTSERKGDATPVTLADRAQMPGLRSSVLDWPYVEALRLDEAMHPLTLLAFGMYGEVLPNQNGAFDLQLIHECGEVIVAFGRVGIATVLLAIVAGPSTLRALAPNTNVEAGNNPKRLLLVIGQG